MDWDKLFDKKNPFFIPFEPNEFKTGSNNTKLGIKRNEMEYLARIDFINDMFNFN